MLVSLTQAKAHLRVDSSAEDTHLTLLIRGASASVIEYIRSGADAFTDSAGDVIVDSAGEPQGIPENVQVAVLILVGNFYRYREGESGIINPSWSAGYLPTAVVSLLTPYRDPVFR